MSIVNKQYCFLLRRAPRTLSGGYEQIRLQTEDVLEHVQIGVSGACVAIRWHLCGASMLFI